MHERARNLESPIGAEITIDGRRYINFGGSSYLGLASNTEIIEAGVATLRKYGSSALTSRGPNVITPPYREVEEEAAKFFNSEAAMYFATGYHFGLLSITATQEQFSSIFYDELSHYSLRDGIAASGLKNYSYRHLDAEDLNSKLKQNLRATERPLLVTDGMFPARGEIAPLDELARIVAPYSGRLVIDESHSFGVLGPSGRGASEHYNISASSSQIGGSLAKAFGAAGGIIPASAQEVAVLRATAVGVGSSGGLPAGATMGAKSLRYVRQHPELLQRLRANVAYLKSGLREIGLDVGDSVAPVAAFVAGSDNSMQALAERLMSENIVVYHLKYIGAGAAGVIRCSIFADHTDEHMDRLLEAFRRLL